MFTILPSLLRYGIPFLAGVALTQLANGYVTRGEHLEQQAAVIEQKTATAERVQSDVKESSDNVTEYMRALEMARTESDSLRSSLSSGAISLRLCRADRVLAGVSADNSAAALEQARADQRRLEADAVRLVERAAKVDAWVKSAHRYINAHATK